jgi:hypothetical protein
MQFVEPGWRFLKVGGGSGLLPLGGSYVTLVPPAGSSLPEGTLTLIVETLTGTCGENQCNVAYPALATQSLSFDLKGSLSSATSVYLWCSSASAVFVNRGKVPVTGGVLSITMEPDTICTATTLTNGTKGQHPTPPASTPFPTHHADDFSSYVDDALAWGFSDVYGSFAVRSGALSQLATDHPGTHTPHLCFECMPMPTWSHSLAHTHLHSTTCSSLAHTYMLALTCAHSLAHINLSASTCSCTPTCPRLPPSCTTCG